LLELSQSYLRATGLGANDVAYGFAEGFEALEFSGFDAALSAEFLCFPTVH